MSARRIEGTTISAATSRSTQCLTLPAKAVRVRKSGIEFRSESPIAPWTEMTVSLEGLHEKQKVKCTGVIVECSGSLQNGYLISMLFTNLSPQSQELLNSRAY